MSLLHKIKRRVGSRIIDLAGNLGIDLQKIQGLDLQIRKLQSITDPKSGLSATEELVRKHPKHPMPQMELVQCLHRLNDPREFEQMDRWNYAASGVLANDRDDDTPNPVVGAASFMWWRERPIAFSVPVPDDLIRSWMPRKNLPDRSTSSSISPLAGFVPEVKRGYPLRGHLFPSTMLEDHIAFTESQNLTSIQSYLLSEESRHPEANGDFTWVLSAISLSASSPSVDSKARAMPRTTSSPTRMFPCTE